MACRYTTINILLLEWSLVLAFAITSTEAFIKPKCRGVWTDWGRWKGRCTDECTGVRRRTRTCVNNGLFYCGKPRCHGESEQRRQCGGDRIDGQWGAWSVPDCRYCGQKRLRTRQCDSPAPSCGGADCQGGDNVEIVYCGDQGCPALPPNLITQNSDLRCGATVAISCPRCHRLEGPGKLKCLPDGRWNKAAIPQCVPLDGVEAQWSAFGPWDSECLVCNQVLKRRRECRSVCGEICQGEAEELYICGNVGCSINSFIHRSANLISSKSTAMCGESVSLRCRSSTKTLLGSEQLTCGLGGWEGVLPDCVDETCPDIPNLKNGKVMSTGLTYGKFSQFICDVGYDLEGQQYLVCLGNQWSYHFPTCVKEVDECEQLQLSDNLLLNTTSAAIGTAVHLDCIQGYQLIGAAVIECQETGQWNKPLPVCQKIICLQVGEIDHAIVVHSNSGRRVNVTCEVGYVLSGESVLTCTSAGTWDHQPPVCRQSICQLPTTDNGEWYMLSSGTPYRVADRNIALLRCDRGYTAEGDSELLCMENNEWGGDTIGRCVVKSCPVIPAIQEGSVSTANRDVGTVAMVTCNEGYAISGHWKLSCQASGEWDFALPLCRKSACQLLPPIENGYVSSQLFEQGSLVDIVCEEGYRLVGERSLLCLTTGEWSAAMPRCELFGCVSPPIKNGTIATDVIPLQRTSRVVCQDGFLLEGPDSVLCTATGAVDISPQTRCIPKSCHIISVPDGEVTVDDVIYGSVGRVVCDYGYRLERAGVTRCEADGRWSPVPVCQRIVCTEFPVLYRGYLEGDSYSVGSTASLICDVGYTPREQQSVICTETGMWSAANLDCIPNDCPTLQDPENGMFISRGSSVALLCNEGYKVLGSSRISCEGNSWNDTIPICALDIQCPVLPVPYKGALSTNSTEYGTQVEVHCTNGHVLSHTTPINCNISGQWNTTLPSCNFPDCEDVAGNGITITGVEVGDTARVNCDTCQKRQGSRHSICVAGGMWQPPIASCQTVTCTTKINKRLYESVEGAIPTQCGKSVTFVCKPGYTTIGRTTITCYDTGQYDYHVPFCVESGIFRVRRLRRR